MVDLANQPARLLVKRQDIIMRQGIPLKYLDQIMMNLRRSQLVTSVRGRLGGYLIGKDPKEISVWDVFASVEDGFYPVKCVSETDSMCHFESYCQTKEPWNLIYTNVRDSLSALRLSDIADKVNETKSFGDFIPLDQSKSIECPSGNSS